MDSFDASASGDSPSTSKSLKSNFKSWREIIVVASKFLKWEKPYYPVVVFGAITFVFLMIWYLDPPVITGVSMFMIIICIFDYLIPRVSPLLFPETHWNSEKEKEFSSACSGINSARSFIHKSFNDFFKLKETNPWLYVAVALVSLSTLSWLGNQMHNMMLLYFATMIAASLPGLSHHGLLSKGAEAVSRFGKKHR